MGFHPLSSTGNYPDDEPDIITMETHHPLLSIMVRMHSAKPSSTACERINSMNKIMQSPQRGKLSIGNLRKLLYCFVNLRLLNEVDDEVEDMIDSMVQFETEQCVRARSGAHGALSHPYFSKSLCRVKY